MDKTISGKLDRELDFKSPRTEKDSIINLKSPRIMEKIAEFNSPTKKTDKLNNAMPQQSANSKQKSEKDVMNNKKSLFVDKIDINNLRLSDPYLSESPNLSKYYY